MEWWAAFKTFWVSYGDSILAVLVFFHLITEYFHYVWEFITGNREAGKLDDILHHRNQSTKTHRLCCMQADIHLIKEHLGIEEE